MASQARLQTIVHRKPRRSSRRGALDVLVVLSLLAVACGGETSSDVPESPASQTAAAAESAPEAETQPESAPEPEVPSLPPLAVPDPSLLAPETLRYSLRVESGDDEVKGTSQRVVTREAGEAGEVWRVATTTDVGSGSLDEYVLDAATLAPLRREASDGPSRLVLAFTDGAIEGELKLGQSDAVPISVKLDAPVTADTSALEWVMTSWPLEPGYAATARTFDAMSQRVRVWRFAVTGTEEVEVPAGKFAAYKIGMLPTDGTPGLATLWISQSPPRRLLRSETALPGALIQAELIEITGG